MRTKKSIQNVVVTLGAQIINIILTFLGRTVFNTMLGEECLGINTVFTQTLTVLSLAELGFGSAIIYSMYKPLADGNEEKIRLIGIDCPEYTKEIEAYGKEATEFTTEKLLNKTIYLQKDITNTDNYDRLLRYVWTQKIDEITDENTKNYLFNYTLVYEGLANSNYYKPNTTLQNYLEEAEDYAKENKKGMWQ